MVRMSVCTSRPHSCAHFYKYEGLNSSSAGAAFVGFALGGCNEQLPRNVTDTRPGSAVKHSLTTSHFCLQ